MSEGAQSILCDFSILCYFSIYCVTFLYTDYARENVRTFLRARVKLGGLALGSTSKALDLVPQPHRQ